MFQCYLRSLPTVYLQRLYSCYSSTAQVKHFVQFGTPDVPAVTIGTKSWSTALRECLIRTSSPLRCCRFICIPINDPYIPLCLQISRREASFKSMIVTGPVDWAFGPWRLEFGVSTLNPGRSPLHRRSLDVLVWRTCLLMLSLNTNVKGDILDAKW